MIVKDSNKSACDVTTDQAVSRKTSLPPRGHSHSLSSVEVKTIVHPKIELLWVILELNTKKTLWRMLVTKQLTVAIVLVWKNYMEVNGYRQLLCNQHSSKHLLLCLTQERNSYRFWDWQNDHFWLNYPFKKDLEDTSKHFTDIQSHHHICSDLSGAYPYLCTLQSTMLPS